MRPFFVPEPFLEPQGRIQQHRVAFPRDFAHVPSLHLETLGARALAELEVHGAAFRLVGGSTHALDAVGAAIG